MVSNKWGIKAKKVYICTIRITGESSGLFYILYYESQNDSIQTISSSVSKFR